MKNLKLALYLLIPLLVFSCLAPLSKAEAVTEVDVTLYPTEDATIFSATPDENYGNTADLQIAETSTGGIKLSFVKFALNEIPTDATIIGAMYRMYIDQCDGVMNPNEIRVGQLNGDWNEDTITFNNKPGRMTPGPGVDATCDGPTWYTYDILSIVQNWVSGQPNYGLMLYAVSVAPYGRSFFSREYGGMDYQPQLIIAYIQAEETPPDTNPTPPDGGTTPPDGNTTPPDGGGDTIPPADDGGLISPAPDGSDDSEYPELPEFINDSGVVDLPLVSSLLTTLGTGPCIGLLCCCPVLAILILILIIVIAKKKKAPATNTTQPTPTVNQTTPTEAVQPKQTTTP